MESRIRLWGKARETGAPKKIKARAGVFNV